MLHPALASKVVAFVEGLAAEAGGSEADFVAIEVVHLAIAVEAMVIAEALVAEVGSDIKEVADLEAEVRMPMVLLRPTHPVGQAAAVVGMLVNPTGPPPLNMVIVAVMATAIAMHTVEAARLEVQDMKAGTREAQAAAIENQSSSLEIEALVEIETVTEIESEVIVTGMAAEDEMTTLDRENDTTKVMDMTTQEAKEGIKSLTTA